MERIRTYASKGIDKAIVTTFGTILTRELQRKGRVRFQFGTFTLTKRKKNYLTDEEGKKTRVPHMYVSFKMSERTKRTLRKRTPSRG